MKRRSIFDRLTEKLQKDYKKGTLRTVADAIGVDFVALWRVLNKKSRGSVEFWEKVEAHYYR